MSPIAIRGSASRITAGLMLTPSRYLDGELTGLRPTTGARRGPTRRSSSRATNQVVADLKRIHLSFCPMAIGPRGLPTRSRTKKEESRKHTGSGTLSLISHLDPVPEIAGNKARCG